MSSLKAEIEKSGYRPTDDEVAKYATRLQDASVGGDLTAFFRERE